MCCPTGVCGPSVDPEVLRIAGLLSALEGKGYPVRRHGLSQEPQAFVDNAEVARILKEEGVSSLPLTFVDGRLVAKGSYPSNETLGEALGVTSFAGPTSSGPCCCGGESEGDDCCGPCCC